MPRRAGFGMAESVGLGFRIGFVAMLLLTLGWAVSNLRQVPADSRAVVQRFGQIVRVQNTRLMLAWPSPIEQITLVPAWDRQIALKMVVPVNSGPSAETDFQIRQPDDVVSLRRQKDAWNGEYFLTGDGSVVQFEATLYYRITDPAAFVLAHDHVEPALQRLYRASAVALAAGHDLDDFLVARPRRPTCRPAPMPPAAARRCAETWWRRSTSASPRYARPAPAWAWRPRGPTSSPYCRSGVLLITLLSTSSHGGNGLAATNALFGSIYSLSTGASRLAAAIGVAVSVAVVLAFRPLLLATLDAELAAVRASGSGRSGRRSWSRWRS